MSTEVPNAGRDRSSGSPPGRQAAILALLGVGLLWSTGGALIKAVDWPPAAIWSLRSGIAALVLTAILRPRWRGIRTAEWGAALALTATTGLFILANKWTTAANAILIQYSAPAWAAIMATFFLGERATRLDWLTIGLALCGVSLFFVEDLSFDHAAGNAVALAAGVAFATNVVLLRKLARDHHPGVPTTVDPALRSMILGHALAAVIGAPFLVTAPNLPAEGWAAMLALGLIQQSIPTAVYAWSIRRVTAVEGLLIPIVEPVVSPLWVWLTHGEAPSRWAIVGGAIVVGAITLRSVVPARRATSTGT